MFAVSPAPSSSFSRAGGDGGLFLKLQHPQQPQIRPRLSLDQAATSSSEGGLLHHPLEMASSLSSFSTLSRSSADDGLSPQAATLLLSLSRAGSAGLHHHHRQLQQHGLRIQAAISPSYPSLSSCAGNGNLLQQAQNHLCHNLPSTFSCSGGLLQQSSGPRLQAHSQQHLSLQEQQGHLLRQQQKQEITKKHLADILESIAEDRESLKNSALASTNSQIDPNARGYLPPEIDISSCRSV